MQNERCKSPETWDRFEMATYHATCGFGRGVFPLSALQVQDGLSVIVSLSFLVFIYSAANIDMITQLVVLDIIAVNMPKYFVYCSYQLLVNWTRGHQPETTSQLYCCPT